MFVNHPKYVNLFLLAMRARQASAFENEYYYKKDWKGYDVLCVKRVQKGTSRAKTTYEAYQQKKGSE